MELNVKAVRLAMIDKGFSIAELSRRSKIAAPTISKWLNHGTKPQNRTVGALAKALEVPVTSIIIMD